MGQYRKSFLRLHCQVCYINSIIQRWGGTWVKDICLTRCSHNNIGLAWQMTFKRLWEIVGNASKISLLRSDDAPYNYSGIRMHWN